MILKMRLKIFKEFNEFIACYIVPECYVILTNVTHFLDRKFFFLREGLSLLRIYLGSI